MIGYQALIFLRLCICGWIIRLSHSAPTSSNSTGTRLSASPKFDCIPRGGAHISECAQALLQFPKDVSPAGFRQIGGSPHRYVLPQTQVHPPGRPGACGILVDFPEPRVHRDDTSSWSAILTTGSLLLQACSGPGTGYVSGWAAVGDEEYMRIMIMDARYLPRAAGISSLTSALAATS
ncbi:MAG: hypothetical protein L6R36_007810 [Xanthoria steineri]|nr:MAG: hypothetical protein L6R36_007810 [Xanthoria steineri]